MQQLIIKDHSSIKRTAIKINMIIAVKMVETNSIAYYNSLLNRQRRLNKHLKFIKNEL